MDATFADLDYKSREDSFVLKQIKARADIRTKEDRARPIDLIIFEHDPLLIHNLNEEDKQELQNELIQLQELEKNKLLQLYYSQILIMMNKIDNNFITNTTLESLSKLQKDVELKLTSETLDFEYWQNILDEIKYKKSVLVVKEIYEYLKNKPKEDLQREVVVKKDMKLIQEPYEEEMEPLITREIMVKDAKLKVVDEELDMQELLKKRQQLQSKKLKSWVLDKKPRKVDTNDDYKLSKFDTEFLQEALSDMHADETFIVSDTVLDLVSLEFPLYQPRDPIYLVRILSRKENSIAHIYGYKFYISFEKLVDKKIPPSYRVDKDGDSKDTEIVVFSGGAPYYDIAFRVIKKEWELDTNKGYKSEFSDVGVLQLWFRFKRC